jgi:hypothetical protein
MLDETLVSLVVSHLATTVPLFRGAINQPEREGDDSTGDDARIELSETISVVPPCVHVAEYPQDNADREQPYCDRQQDGGMSEPSRPVTGAHARGATGKDAGQTRVAVSARGRRSSTR